MKTMGAIISALEIVDKVATHLECQTTLANKAKRHFWAGITHDMHHEGSIICYVLAVFLSSCHYDPQKHNI